MKKTVYLFGYLRKDCPFDLEWRKHAHDAFVAAECRVLDPARGHAEKLCDPVEVCDLFAPHELFHRDRQDILKADILFGVIQPRPQDRPPVGSLVELGMAHEMPGQRLVCLVSQDPDITEHPFVKETTTMIFSDLYHALDFVRANWL